LERSPSRRRAVLASLLLIAGVSVWYWWPREVAQQPTALPQLTPQMVEAIGHSGRRVTVIPPGQINWVTQIHP
jgi:hypothetical protein